MNAKVRLGKTEILADKNGFGALPIQRVSDEDAVKLLMIGPEYTQIVIKTEKAAKQLHFIKSQKIEGITGEALKKEQDAYQEIFARELNKILDA